MWLRSGSTLLALAMLVGVPPSARADVAAELLPLVPEDANALVIIRVQKLLDSPRAQREKWREKQDADFLAGSVSIGTWFDTVVRGAKVTAAEPGGVWSVGLAMLPGNVSLDAISEQVNGHAERIAGKPVIVSPRGYFASLAPGVVGVMSANAPRQDFARWLRRSSLTGPPKLSSYLLTASNDSTADILVAVDTLDAPSPAVLRERLAKNAVLKGRDDDQRALYDLLVGMRGFQLAIDVEDKTQATLTFTFSSKVTSHAELLKPILIELLDDAGAAIDELRDAEVRMTGSTLTLGFALTDAGLRRVMSLVPMPTLPVANSAGGSGSSKTADLAASRKYYSDLNRLLTDLERLNRTAKDYRKTSTWHDAYAKRIDELPIVGVDAELLDYGAGVAQKLRLLASSLRGTKIDLAALQAKTQYSVSVSPIYGPAGSFTAGNNYTPAPWEVSSNLDQVREAQAEAVAKGASQREQVWQAIQSDKQKIRNRMAEKYQVDFDKAGK
jgi:hypothetical protein